MPQRLPLAQRARRTGFVRMPNGALLFLALVISSCRSDKPPAIPICTADGFGGADCDFTGVSPEIAPLPLPGSQVGTDPAIRYLKPTELRNFFMTSQPGMERLAAWCYDTDAETVRAALKLKR